MRNALLGILAGLAIGGVSSFAYEHYLGEGSELAQAQTDLASANAALAKIKENDQQLKSEIDATSAQIQQLSSTKEDLKRQLNELKSTSTATTTPPASNSMADMMKAGMAQHEEQQLLLLKARLHLTPEQETAVKAALDEEAKRGEEMMSKITSGGKIDPTAIAELKNIKSVDQTLNDILTPDQKTAYQQMKTDQKNSAMEMVATAEMNQISPLLQLSDSQKDQVYSALYQVHLDTTDPAWIKNNLSNPTDPTAILEAQAKAKEDALAKILSPDQLATYHQQVQSQLDMQKAMMQKFTLPTPAPAAP